MRALEVSVQACDSSSAGRGVGAVGLADDRIVAPCCSGGVVLVLVCTPAVVAAAIVLLAGR